MYLSLHRYIYLSNYKFLATLYDITELTNQKRDTMEINRITSPNFDMHTQPQFQAYLKFKTTPANINKLKQTALSSEKNIILINHKKGAKKESIEALTGSQLDKFLDLAGKIYFRDLRTNLAKYIGEKPKKASVKKYIEKLNKNA